MVQNYFLGRALVFMVHHKATPQMCTITFLLRCVHVRNTRSPSWAVHIFNYLTKLLVNNVETISRDELGLDMSRGYIGLTYRLCYLALSSNRIVPRLGHCSHFGHWGSKNQVFPPQMRNYSRCDGMPLIWPMKKESRGASWEESLTIGSIKVSDQYI